MLSYLKDLCRLMVLPLCFVFGAVGVSRAQPDYAPALWNQAATNHWYTSGVSHSFCVIHDMEGYYEATISLFQNPKYDADAYYLVNSLKNGNDPAHHYVENNPNDAEAGEITQMVREKYWAWHVVCWNPYMFGTEHEGFADSPAWYSEAMYQASAALQRHLCTTYNIPEDRFHIIGHQEWQNANWVRWMATNWPEIDTTCNNHQDPGIYWDWNHFMALIVGTNARPAVNIALVNRAVDAGANFTFNVGATGTAPLSYQWYFNGVPIPGGTSTNYNLSSVQLTDAGKYFVVITNAFGSATSSVATLMVNQPQTWVMVYSDNFDTDTSANWKLFQGSANNVPDYSTNWAFDYSTNKYVFTTITYTSTNHATNTIPLAPKTTNGTRIGLRLSANKNDAIAAAAGLSLYPKNQSFGSNYMLRFDLWMNYNGVSGGGNGSTESATFGINHKGTQVNWGAGSASSSDGLWFSATGEGGAASDYTAYADNATGNPSALSLAAGGFATDGAQTLDASDPLFENTFYSPPYETPGSPGKHWVQGEISQVNNVVTLKFNNVVISERTNTTAFTNGDIMIGYMDIFSSIANPGADNYAIFDNVQVFQAAVAPVITMQPQSQTIPVGNNAIFSVNASGFPAVGYIWQFNGLRIPGANSSTYTVTNARTADMGNYSVLVTNSVRPVLSSNAVLTVTVPAPKIQQISLTPGGGLQIQVNGPPNSIYAVDASTNLVIWTQIATFTNGVGAYQFTDHPATNNLQNFYRVRWLSD